MKPAAILFGLTLAAALWLPANDAPRAEGLILWCPLGAYGPCWNIGGDDKPTPPKPIPLQPCHEVTL